MRAPHHETRLHVSTRRAKLATPRHSVDSLRHGQWALHAMCCHAWSHPHGRRQPARYSSAAQRSAVHRAAALYRVHRRVIERWCVRRMHTGHDTNRRKQARRRAARRSGQRGAQGHAMRSPPASQCAWSRGEEAVADRAALRHRRRRSPSHHSLHARTDSEELGRAGRGMPAKRQRFGEVRRHQQEMHARRTGALS